MVHQDRNRKAIQIPGGGSLALQVNRRTKRRRDGSDPPSSADFAANVIVQLAARRSRLVISVNQAYCAAGSFLSTPRLAVHNVVPSNSSIFELAKEGKIQDILELVGSGRASLHDRDERGWSLLHVSPARYFHLSPDLSSSSARLLTHLSG